MHSVCSYSQFTKISQNSFKGLSGHQIRNMCAATPDSFMPIDKLNVKHAMNNLIKKKLTVFQISVKNRQE